MDTKTESNAEYHTDNSNDRPYKNTNDEYVTLVNISYLKSGIYFSKNPKKNSNN